MFPAGTTRYFADGNVPTVFLHNGEHVTFRFNYDDSAQGFTYTFSGLGAALTAEVSPTAARGPHCPVKAGSFRIRPRREKAMYSTCASQQTWAMPS